MTNDARRVFIDTNILVYAQVDAAPLHKQANYRLEQLWEQYDELWISRQVIREFIVVLTRPQQFSNPIPTEQVIEQARAFQQHFHVADDTQAVGEQLLEILRTVAVGGKNAHDANIVATMLAQGIRELAYA